MSTNFLAKPRRNYIVQPDILNFPTKNKELSQDFNFVMEMFKFLPKMQQLAFEGKRFAPEKDIDAGTAQTLGGIELSEEWIQALNEYSISDTGIYGDSYANKDHYGDTSWTPLNNEQVIAKYETAGGGPWDWHTDWVAGFNHFNVVLFAKDGEYFWGEAVGRGLENVDFIAEGCEWNHLEERTPIGSFTALLTNGPPRDKDASLDTDVNKTFFLTDAFLGAIGSSWPEVNSVLNKFSGQSFYQLVMNSTQPDRVGASYKAMNSRELFLMVAAMIEARNRVYSISEKIFGSVALTWDDQQMMAAFDNWLTQHNSSAVSHGINAFRILFQMQHLFLNEMAMFSATDESRGYAAGVLDRAAFKQFSKDLGGEFYSGASGNKGALFSFIESMGITLNSDVIGFLRGNLASMNIHTRPEDIPLPENLQGYGGKLQAAKWLVEQWFGSNKVLAGYNERPKSETFGPSIDFSKKNEENGYEEYNGIKVPWAISNPGAARSYGWDRVSGPFFDWRYDCRSNNFIKTNDEQYQEWSPEWASVYQALDAKYGLAYLNPNTFNENVNHRNYNRMIMGGLNIQEIMGRSGNLDPYNNSWAVYQLGNLIRYGEVKDKVRMNIYNFRESTEKFRFKRAQAEFEEEKDRIKDEESRDGKYENKVKNNYQQMKKRGEALLRKAEMTRKQEEASLAKKSDAKHAENAKAQKKSAGQAPQKASKKA